jgi:hypothetical protein
MTNDKQSTETILKKVEKTYISPWESGELNPDLPKEVRDLIPKDKEKTGRVFRPRRTTQMKVPKDLLGD